MKECICEETLKREDNILTEEEIKFLCKKYTPIIIDDNEPEDGVFAIPRDKTKPRYNIRVLDNYCKERNFLPKDLTEKELKQFEVVDSSKTK